MIYRVVLDDLYDLHTSDIDCMLLNPSLELEMNSAGSFNFTLPPAHPYWDRIEILKSTIDVYEDDDLIFTGRVANIDKNWNNERVVECEGALAYFNDSIHRQMKWETPLPIASEDPTVHNFLKDILDNHNVFVGDAVNRQIHIGHIYVDPFLVTREVDYDTTLDILTRMCIDTNGGYFMIRKDPETHLLYLDWLKDFTEESGQPASFGVNLLNFNTGLHAEDICTGVLARGATVNDQVVTLSNVELVDETTYPDMSVDHYTDRYQDILWHREGMAKFGQVVQVHDFPDAQTDWKNNGQVVANSLFEEARKWLEEKNTKIESIEVEVAELSWLQEGVPKYKLGQIVEILDDAHMAGEPYEVRRLPMYKLSCDLSSGSKKVTLGRPPKKELTQISASNSDSSTLSSGNSSGSSSGGGSGSGEECKVHDVRVDGNSVVSNKIANISLSGKADVSTVNALAATVATKADTSTVNALANVVSGKQDQIEFNTLEAATETLTRLKADNKVYNLGGGTEVIANPSESATDDLETIKIGNTVYDIPGSGGGSTNYGKFKCDVIFDTPTTTSIWANPIEICSEEKVKEYDMLHILSYTYTNEPMAETILVDDIGQSIDSFWLASPRTDINVNGVQGFIFLAFTNSKLCFYTGTGNSVTLYKVYGLKFENKLINRSDIYSEEERIIGRWTDGKLLYQKTYKNLGINLPASTWTSTGITFSDIDYYKVISNKSYLSDAQSQYPMLYRYYQGTFQAFCQWQMPLDELIIQYTKTTDAPGSGFLPEDPQMVMMTDYYSEDEQVIGRWTDGKPLYQKTIRIQNSTMSSGMIKKDISNLNPEMCFIDYSGSAFHDALNNNWMSLDWIPSQASMSYAVYVYSDITLNGNKEIIINSQNHWSNRIDDMYITIQYTKTTDTPGTGPTKGNLIYLPTLYSEEEREVGVWTDGKPIYQRTWIFASSISISYSSFTNTTIDSSNIENIVCVKALHDDGTCYEGIMADPTMSSHTLVGLQTTRNGDTASVKKLTLQYTKITDQPGSGTWTPEGQLAHHYSTSEQVIGTWIDGSTIYEKTWDLGSDTAFPNNTWTTIVNNVGISINKIIKCEGIQTDPCAVSFDIWFDTSSNSLKARSLRDGNESIRYFTIQYTKSS